MSEYDTQDTPFANEAALINVLMYMDIVDRSELQVNN